MEDIHREKLNRNKNKLIQLIDFDNLYPRLNESSIFTEDMMKDINNAGPAPLNKNERLLNNLPKRGPEAYGKFVKCLVDSAQFPAARILNEAIPDAGLWNGSITPATRSFNDDTLIYPMQSKPRGIALILSNIDFDNNVNPKRLGGEIDEENLNRLFKYLGFVVILHRNKTAQEIEQIFENLRSDHRHTNADALFVVILSHGSPRGFFSSDNIIVSNDAIVGKFNNKNCPLLHDKPKVFFLQHCRGDTPDYAIRKFGFEPTYPDSAGEMKSIIKPFSLPAWSDIKICYSTSASFVSLRSPDSGTWFIRILIDVFSTRAHDTHLDDMLLEVANKMLQLDSFEGWKQSPEFRNHGWRKKLYFNPGQ